MSTDLIKILFAGSIFANILLAGWYPFRKRRQQMETHLDFPIGETLASGVFLGAALLHLLPQSNDLFRTQGYVYPYAYLICGLTFLLFLWLEHVGKELYHHTTHHHAGSSSLEPHQRLSMPQKSIKEHPAFAILAWIMLSIHSFVLGTTLGFSDDFSLVIMLFLAIFAHKWAESFAIAVQLNRSTLRPINSAILFFIFALMSPLGILIGWMMDYSIGTHSFFDPLLLAISAGTILYLGTLHGLEQCVMVERCCNLKHFSFVIIGFLLMASVAAYL